MNSRGSRKDAARGECGACTVLVDGESINACLFPAFEVDGKTVMTIEGLVGEGNPLRPHSGGVCRKWRYTVWFLHPRYDHECQGYAESESEVQRKKIFDGGFSGNLCRCTGYVQIVESIKQAAAVEERG